MSWSCPFHSFQLPLHVPVIFSVCPLHFPCMSRSFVASHFPTSPVVPIGCLVLRFHFISPALPLFSFLSLSFPLAFLLTSYFLPSFPCTFLNFPFAPQYFPQKRRFFPACSQRIRRTKTQGFSRFLAKGGRKANQQKIPRGTWGTPLNVSDVGGGFRGRLSSILS